MANVKITIEGINKGRDLTMFTTGQDALLLYELSDELQMAGTDDAQGLRGALYDALMDAKITRRQKCQLNNN